MLRAAFIWPEAEEKKRKVCGLCRDSTLDRQLRVHEIASLAVLARSHSLMPGLLPSISKPSMRDHGHSWLFRLLSGVAKAGIKETVKAIAELRSLSGTLFPPVPAAIRCQTATAKAGSSSPMSLSGKAAKRHRTPAGFVRERFRADVQGQRLQPAAPSRSPSRPAAGTLRSVRGAA